MKLEAFSEVVAVIIRFPRKWSGEIGQDCVLRFGPKIRVAGVDVPPVILARSDVLHISGRCTARGFMVLDCPGGIKKVNFQIRKWMRTKPMKEKRQ